MNILREKTGRTKLYNHGVMFRHSNQICNSFKLHPLLLIISCSIVNCTWRLFQSFAKFVNQGSNMQKHCIESGKQILLRLRDRDKVHLLIKRRNTISASLTFLLQVLQTFTTEKATYKYLSSSGSFFRFLFFFTN